LLVYQAGSQPRVVLTVRAETLGRHRGQVSLPGGVVEPGETFEQAALREAREEIALPSESVAVLGPLTPVDIVVSGFRLHPIVACAPQRPSMHPADGEVGRILEVPVDSLMDPTVIVSRDLEREGHRYEVPTFLIQDAELWGATAMVLAEFLVLLGWRGPSAM
jgi:8-oxo-dGTP pyrophosphatase MutT (NUDIX family)